MRELNDIIGPGITALDYEFVGCEYLPQGKYSLLRVYIDSEQGITAEDCGKASHFVSSVLDVEDPVQGAYTLEVSSPGLDRPLFTAVQYQRFIGEQVKIRVRHSQNGRRNFTGNLVEVDDCQVVLLVDGENAVLPFAEIEKANLVPKFKGE